MRLEILLRIHLEIFLMFPNLPAASLIFHFILTNGNTPQGIFRMYGFGVSMSNFIGPTANIQMGMPVEISMKKFLDDSTILDSNWTIDQYQKLHSKKTQRLFAAYIIRIMQGLQEEVK